MVAVWCVREGKAEVVVCYWLTVTAADNTDISTAPESVATNPLLRLSEKLDDAPLTSKPVRELNL